MPVNPYFNNYSHAREQDLYNNLVVEAIRMFGFDVIYMPRTVGVIDEVLNEARMHVFDKAFTIEMYLKSADSFAGEGDFLSKFGLQINDQAVLSVAISVFNEIVTSKEPSVPRPLEGDLLFFPFNGKLLKVMHAEHESVFYQNGKLKTFDIKCELLDYSNDRFATGIPAIDTYFDNVKTDNIDNLTDLNNIDPIAKNIFYEDEIDDVLDMSEVDPLDEIISFPRRV